MANNGYQDAMMRRLGIIGDMGQVASQISARPVAGPSMGGGVMPPGGSGSGMKGLLDFGHFLQSRGFKVSENSNFGGVTQGAHVQNSDHYRDRAIDVNYAPGTSSKEQNAIDAIMKYAQQYGMKSIWRAPGHFNHAHFYL